MRSRLIIVFVLFVALTTTYAETNFSGIWKMDPGKSDWGPVTPPTEAKYVVRHIGSKLSFNYVQDGNISRVDITPDNEERITSTTEETAVWTRAYWTGNVLVLQSRERKRFGTQAATGASWESRWSMSEDGRALIIDRKIRNNRAEVVQHVVYDKQPLTRSSQEN